MATAVGVKPPVEKVYEEDRRAQYFREEVARLKLVIKDEFEKIHTGLREKEKELQTKLDLQLQRVEEMVRKRAERVCQLKKGFGELEQGLAHNNLNHLLVGAKVKIDTEIDKLLHQERLELPQFQLQWELPELNNFLNNLCKLSECTHPYTYRNEPVTNCVNEGDKVGLVKPRGLAVDTDGRVYIADYTSNQVEVFSHEGEHVNSLVDRKMREPLYLCVSADSLYVSCENRCLLRFNVESGKKSGVVETQLHVSGLCGEGEDRLIGCVWQKNRIYVFDKEMVKEREVQLNTKYYKQGVTLTADIKVTCKHELVVLFYKITYPVQLFSKEGELLRCLVSQEKLGGALYFCQDGLDNLLVTDIGSHQLKIFTPQGDLLTKVGKKGQQGGEFQTPVGVSMNQYGDVYVCDCKQNYMLQRF